MILTLRQTIHQIGLAVVWLVAAKVCVQRIVVVATSIIIFTNTLSLGCHGFAVVSSSSIIVIIIHNNIAINLSR